MKTEEKSQDSPLSYEQFLPILLGLVTGISLAKILSSFLPDFSESLEKAKSLGIISETVTADYPKEPEFYTFVLVIILSTLASSLAWYFLYFRNTKQQRPVFPIIGEEKIFTSVRPVSFIVVCLVIFALTFSGDFLFKNWFADWSFYGEEGGHFGWIGQALMGKSLYRDMRCFYGPLMEYPLIYLMKIFSPSILISRIYVYFLYFAGFCLVSYFIMSFFRSAITKFIALALMLAYYFPVLPGIHDAFLRQALGITAVFLSASYIESPSRKKGYLTGITCCAGFFYGQEVGITVSGAIILSYLCLFVLKKDLRAVIRNGIMPFVLGIITAFIPVALMLLADNAFVSCFKDLFLVPYYFSLGFFAIPFPSLLLPLKGFFLSPSPDSLFRLFAVSLQYWPIVIIALSGGILVTRFISGKLEGRYIFFLIMFFFSILYFRLALGRSGIDRNLICLPPVLFLCAMLVEDYLSELNEKRRQSQKIEIRKTLFSFGAIFIFILIPVAGYGFFPAKPAIHRFVYDNLKKVNLVQSNMQMEKLGIEMGKSIYVPSQWAEYIREVVNYVKANTDEDDYILAFPREPIYYFLCKRLNPTPYDTEFMAITGDERKLYLELIKEKKPKLIIFSNHYSLEGGPALDKRVPEVISFIDKNYAEVKSLWKCKIYKPKNEAEALE